MSSSSGKTAAVVGSTGAIGKFVVSQLSSMSHVDRILAFVRRSGAVPSLPKVEEKVVEDFTKLSPSSFTGVSLLFCCLGARREEVGLEQFLKQDRDLIISIATAAKQAGVQHFSLVSTIGADPSSTNTYLQAKGYIETSIIALNFDRFSIFRPSVLRPTERRAQFRFGECCGNCLAVYFCGLCFNFCCKQYKAISVEDVARGMIIDSSVRASGNGIFLYNGSQSILNSDCQLLHVNKEKQQKNENDTNDQQNDEKNKQTEKEKKKAKDDDDDDSDSEN